jgi:hypothetical protein
MVYIAARLESSQCILEERCVKLYTLCIYYYLYHKTFTLSSSEVTSKYNFEGLYNYDM